MTEPDSIRSARNQLRKGIADFQPPRCEPLAGSPWIAMSAMQKAIRRGRTEIALHAAATLLHSSPERLWRRLACTAAEDIGIADLQTVSLVTAAMAGKKARAGWGGEWKTAAYLISKMSIASKCRAADDLLLAAENHPSLEDERLQFAFHNTHELTRTVIGDDPLPSRAIAAWYLLGTDRRSSPHLSHGQGSPPALFQALRDIIPSEVVEIAQEGVKRSSEVLPVFMAMLWPLRQQHSAITEDDELPPEVMVGNVPGWSFDIYSRPGRMLLANFIEGSTDSARWIRAHIPPRQRVTFLGNIVFRSEGGCVKSRLRWKTGDELKRMVDIECNGPHCRDAFEILELMRADIPELNRVRAELIGDINHV